MKIAALTLAVLMVHSLPASAQRATPAERAQALRPVPVPDSSSPRAKVLPATVPDTVAPHTQPPLPPLDLGSEGQRPSDISVLIVPEDEATLSSQMAARVKSVGFKIGQSFRKGDVLVEFDCEEQQAKLQSAQAEYLGARETHVAKLKLQGLGAAGELEVTLAASAAEKAGSAVKQQETQMTFCRILAPYNGQVARVRVKAFESVTVGQPLMEIVDHSRLKAVMHVPSTWLSWLKPGTPVKVKLAETGREHAARVSKLNARVDAVSQSIEIEANFDARDSRILPGMIGAATFPGRTPTARSSIAP